jgi:hypothetical protein
VGALQVQVEKGCHECCTEHRGDGLEPPHEQLNTLRCLDLTNDLAPNIARWPRPFTPKIETLATSFYD